MILVILSTIILSIISTAVLSYISMAVMIGPWIESTIILLASFFFNILLARYISQKTRNEYIALITAGSSVGGILATGCGFAFPTLYFLNPTLFNSWLEYPFYFAAIMTGLSFAAGSLGLFLANCFEHRLLVTDNMSFPVGELSHKMILAQNNIRKSLELAAGFGTSFLYNILQRVMNIPSPLSLTCEYRYHAFTFPALKVPTLELPMLWAIGFVTGHVIAIPLGIGILAKIFITGPAHNHFFSHLNHIDFLFAFGSGMMIYGAFMSFTELPKLIKGIFKHANKQKKATFSLKTITSSSNWIACIIALTSCVLFLTYFEFSPLYQAYLIVLTSLFAYQLAIIGGEFGLAPVGRYATFVMLPAVFIFGINPVHLTLVSTFVEICGGVTVDILFGRKMALLSQLKTSKVEQLQWLGIAISSLTVGIVFWVLITHLGLGSDHLLAQKSQTRALMINIQTFDFFALILGALFGAILKDLKINPIMVLGGILMSLDWSLTLVIAGLSTYLIKNKEEQYPFWSGMFAANSLWMIIKNIF